MTMPDYIIQTTKPRRNDTRDIRAMIWAAFWLLVLTVGEPDLLTAVIDMIGRIG